MGHYVDFLEVKREKDILPSAEYYAELNTDPFENPTGSYHGNMRIERRVTPFESYEAAERYLERFVGDYKDRAVQFKAHIQKPDTKTILRLVERHKTIRAKLHAELDKRNTTAKEVRVNKLRTQLDELTKKIEEARQRNRKSDGIKWLVKVEVHG